MEGGQNRRELARIARPTRVLESRSQRASGILFRPKCAHKTRNYIIVLCEMANHAVAADARRNSADDRHTPLPPRCSIVQAWPPSLLRFLPLLRFLLIALGRYLTRPDLLLFSYS